MQFHEFRATNQPTLMLIHGLATTWQQSFGKFIPLLRQHFYVIAVGLDGHNPDDQSDYINGKKEVEQLE